MSALLLQLGVLRGERRLLVVGDGAAWIRTWFESLGGRKKITGPLGRYPMLFSGSQNGCGLGFKLGE